MSSSSARATSTRLSPPTSSRGSTAALSPASSPAATPNDAGQADARLLRTAGLRVTGPRRAVLAALMDHPHADADTVARHISRTGRQASTQAVYDVLHVLADRGLVRVIEPAGHPARYELRAGDNHHHVVCRSCGEVRDVDCATGTRPCLQASDDHGYVIDEAEVTYWGLCPDCAAAAPA